MNKNKGSQEGVIRHFYALGMFISIVLLCVTSRGLDSESGSADVLPPIISVFLMMLFALCLMIKTNGVGLGIGWIKGNNDLQRQVLFPLPFIVLVTALNVFFEIEFQPEGLSLTLGKSDAIINSVPLAFDIAAGLLLMVVGIMLSAFLFLITKMHDMSRYHGAVKAVILFAVAASMGYTLKVLFSVALSIFENVMAVDFASPVAAIAIKTSLMIAFVCFVVEMVLLVVKVLKGDDKPITIDTWSSFLGVLSMVAALTGFIAWFLFGGDRAMESWRLAFVAATTSTTLGAVCLTVIQNPSLRAALIAKYARPGVLISVLVALGALVIITSIEVTQSLKGEEVSYLLSWADSSPGAALSAAFLGAFVAFLASILISTTSMAISYYWGGGKVKHGVFLLTAFALILIVAVANADFYVKNGMISFFAIIMVGGAYLSAISGILTVVEGSFEEKERRENMHYRDGSEAEEMAHS
jgi:hypothetical protein